MTFREWIEQERKASSSTAKILKAVDSFDWEAWRKELKPKLEEQYRTVVFSQGDKVAQALDAAFNRADPFMQRAMTEYVGERIVELDETSISRVKSLVQGVLEAEGAGSTTSLGDLIADLVREQYDGYADWRADRIARTETAIAYNHGTVFACRQNGVKRVEVSDGDEDEECALADGQIWTLEEALAKPIAHPNCERAFSPIPEGEDE